MLKQPRFRMAVAYYSTISRLVACAETVTSERKILLLGNSETCLVNDSCAFVIADM